MKKKLAYIGTVLALPTLAFAQAITSAQSLAQFTINIINTIVVPLIFAVAFIVFIIGIFQTFILGRGDEEATGKGKSLMIWGLVGFFVMVSVWGLVNILIGTFNLNSEVPNYPSAPTTN
jgi:hypothetical protein